VPESLPGSEGPISKMADMAVGRTPQPLTQRFGAAGPPQTSRRLRGLAVTSSSFHSFEASDYILAHTQGTAIGLAFEGKSVQKV
jgi:hypothetical protein